MSGVDAKDELLRDLEEHLRDSLLEDERGEEFVVEPVEILRDAIAMFERARCAGVVTYPVPANV